MEENWVADSHQAWWQIFLPDRGAWFFIYLLCGMLFLRPELLLWDGGSCRHIINGLMILKDHQIPATNYASAIFPNSECLTRGWLSDLISGLFYQQAQITGVVFICSFVIAIGLTWAYQMGRARGFGLASGMIMLSVVMATVGMHWSARSHVYSYLPFLILYYALFMIDDRRKAISSRVFRVALIGVSMCAWANLHGSFMIGVAMIGIKTVFDAIEVGRKRNLGETLSQLKIDMIGLSIAVVATCINPRGMSFYTHVFSYLANPLIVHKTDEWRAFDLFAGVGAWGYLLLLAMIAILLGKTRKVASPAELAIFLLLAVAGFDSMRLIPYCALIAMPVAAPAWNALRQKYKSESESESESETGSESGSEFETESKTKSESGSEFETESKTKSESESEFETESKTKSESESESASSKHKITPNRKPDHDLLARFLKFEERAAGQEPQGLKIAVGSLVLSLLLGAFMMLMPFTQVKDFDPERLPVQAVDYMNKAKISGLGFNYDNWGGYLYFKLNRPVFIDDWADFLPVSFVDDYLDILTAKPGWQSKFNQYPFAWVLVPNQSQLAQLLSQSPAWNSVYKDEVDILLIRKPAGAVR